jgi:hypothetical protein
LLAGRDVSCGGSGKCGLVGSHDPPIYPRRGRKEKARASKGEGETTKGKTMKRGPQRTIHGAYSGDFEESDIMAGGDFAWMPSDKPNVYVVDKQNRTPGRQQIIPDRGGWADDFSRKFPFRDSKHPKY